MRHDALVLDLDTRAGLAIARDLGRQGLALAAASKDAGASGLRTRYAAARLVPPPPEDDLDAYAGALLAHLEAQPTDAVLPSVDASLQALHRHRDAFARVSAPAVASADAVELASSKPRTLELAASLGVHTPRSLRVESAADLAAAAAELPGPVVVKPESSWRDLPDGRGVRLGPVQVASAERASVDGAALVQELVPGRRETVKLFRRDGETLAALVLVCARTWPPLGGSSTMRTTIAPPEDVVDAAERLAAAAGLEGYCEAEFRRDAAGRPVLMEINPRLSQSIDVALRAGVDFARMQLEWARGGRLERTRGYRIGVRVGWLAGDLRLVTAALSRRGPAPLPPSLGTVRAVGADYLVRGAAVEGLALDDPAPVAAAIAFTLRGAARALRGPAAPRPSSSPG